MMVEERQRQTTVVARVLDAQYVRVVGITPQQFGDVFAALKKTWGQRGHPLRHETHDEHPDWHHIRFHFRQQNSDEVSRLAYKLRDEVTAYFRSQA